MIRKVLLACGIVTSLLCVAVPVRLGQRVPAWAAPSILAQAVPDSPSDPTPYDAIDTYIDRQLSRLNVPGAALAIVADDRIMHQRGLGQARPGGTPPSPQTPFVLGSLTKSVTALAVMQLVEGGRVALDAPVQRYLPWFRIADPRASAEVTVRQLLNQTSGLSTASGWSPLADFHSSPEQTARALAIHPLTRPVGSAFEYSNANYVLLGLIIEAASGEDYAAYVEKHIFSPLDMRHSYFTRIGARQNGLAMGHRYWFAHPVADPDEQDPPGSLAAGGLISCAQDMSHYLVAQLNEGRYGSVHILSPAGIARMHLPAVEFKMVGVPGQYGMGWFIDRQDQTGIVWHSGIVPDFFAYMALLPGQKKGLVLLLNADHFLMSNLALLEVGEGAAKLLAGGQPRPIWWVVIPSILRGLLLIPALQVLGVGLTLWRVRGWRRHPDSHPSHRRKWALFVLLPIVPNLLLAVAPILLLSSGLAGFLFVFGPDFSWIAMVCGGFAGAWIFFRTALILWTLREDQPSTSVV